MPTAVLNVSSPVLFCFAPPVHFHVRQDRRELYELSRWQLQRGPAVAARAPVLTFTLFPAESMILGHG